VFGLVGWSLARAWFPAHDPHLSPAGAWGCALAATGLFFASVLLHEMSHALVARCRGLEVTSVTLFLFGGVAALAREPEDRRTELTMAAAGPLASLILAALFRGLAAIDALGSAAMSVFHYVAVANLAVALFNLVPAFPLDGGRLLRSLLWSRRGKAEATRIAARGGILFSYVLMAFGAMAMLSGALVTGLWYTLIGSFLRMASAESQAQVRAEQMLAGLHVRDVMDGDVEALPADASLTEAVAGHFLRSGHEAYPVLRGDTVVCLLRLGDVLRHAPPVRESTSVQGAMAPIDDWLVAGPDEPLGEALTRMIRSGIGRLLVIDHGHLVGLLTATAVLRLLRVRAALA
jgi:Zn-dependent protease